MANFYEKKDIGVFLPFVNILNGPLIQLVLNRGKGFYLHSVGFMHNSALKLGILGPNDDTA